MQPRFQNNFVENKKVVIKYKEKLFTQEQVKTKFLVYGKDKETTNMHQIYKGKNDKELLQAIMELWEMISVYEMLPTNATNPTLTPERTRATSETGKMYEKKI